MNVESWTRFHSDLRHPYWWGIMGLIVIESTVIAIFLASYFYLWIVNSSTSRMSWPGVELPSIVYPSVNIGLLLFCGWSMWYGGVLIHKNKTKAFGWLAVACCIVATLVLWFRWKQMLGLPFSYDENAYASFVWVLSGFHFMHVLAGILGTAVIGWLSFKGYYTEQRNLGVQIDTIYWYYIVASWIPVYFVIYITPRVQW